MAIGLSNNTIKTRIQLKSDTTVNWNQAGINGFIPLSGEIIVYEIDQDHPYARLKVGDGINTINNLPFIEGETLNGKKTEIVTFDNFESRPQYGSSDKLYIDKSTNRIYYFDANGYQQLSNFPLKVTKQNYNVVNWYEAGKVTTASINDTNSTLEIINGTASYLDTSNVFLVTNVEYNNGGNE